VNSFSSAIEEARGRGEKIHMSVLQKENGDCVVVEHDLATNRGEPVAVFRKDIARREDKGDEVVLIDRGRIRASTFALVMAKLVNSGEVDLG
jgi:hypothetical protein